jgi:DNA-binding response OmpR family regulator
MKVLVAEDDQNIRSLLKVVLVGWGYDVIIASDGNEAWLALQLDDAPQLAILDWMMPGMDGAEVCRKVKQEAKAKESYTYIILLTAYEWDDMETGADDYLFKPFKNNELRARLHAGERTIEIQNEATTT